MSPRFTPGVDRKKCGRCGHRRDLHLDREGFLVCVVCDRLPYEKPCDEKTLHRDALARA